MESKGVCVITRIPRGMRVADLRHIFRNFGVERIFLKSNSNKISKRKKRNY